MQKKISSLQNPSVKRLLQLQEKSRIRKKEGCFTVEGNREISLAIKAGFIISELCFCPELTTSDELLDIVHNSNPKVLLTEISKTVYQKIAYRGSTEGLVGVGITKELLLNDLKLRPKPLILVAEAPEKPGNIGALLRTADAANVDAVLIANPKTDLFNPNIIRSSVGCIFTTQVATGSTSEVIAFLKKKEISIFSAALQASQPYHEIDYTDSTAIVVGTEANGLTEEWLQNSSQNIKIPMQGEIDSMNVSVAAGILIFEAKRQRKFQ